MSQYFESFPEPTQWNGDPEPEQEWDREPEEDDPDDCMDCGVCDNCVERTKAYYEEMESEPHDAEVERELIREANERNAELMRIYRFLEQLRQAVERFKKAGER